MRRQVAFVVSLLLLALWVSSDVALGTETEEAGGTTAGSSGPAIAGDPAVARPIFIQARDAFARGEYAEAARLFRRSFEAYRDWRLIYNVGQALRRGGQYEDAITAYREYLQNAPNADNLAHIHIGECLVRLNRREEANQSFRRYLALEENGEFAGAAQRAIDTGQAPSANDRRDLETVRAAGQVVDRADALWDAERFAEAARVFLDGYRQFPDLHELLYNAGLAYLDARMWREAAQAFARYVRTPGADHDALAFLAECHDELFEFADAVQTYERYIEVEPNGTYADVARDYVRAIMGPSTGSEHRGQPPSREDVENAERLYTEAMQQYREGHYEQARRAFEAAYMSVHDRNLYFNMGRCDEQLRNWAGARASYQSYLEAGDQGRAASGHLFLARVLLHLSEWSEASRHIRAYVDRANAELLPNEIADLRWARELLQQANTHSTGDDD